MQRKRLGYFSDGGGDRRVGVCGICVPKLRREQFCKRWKEGGEEDA